MANRYFSQFQGTLEKGVVELFAKISFGVSGAPTLARGKGIAGVSRTSAGLFVVTLQDSYNALLGVDARFLVAGVPAAPLVSLTAETVASTKLITLTTLGVSGVLANLAVSGTVTSGAMTGTVTSGALTGTVTSGAMTGNVVDGTVTGGNLLADTSVTGTLTSTALTGTLTSTALTGTLTSAALTGTVTSGTITQSGAATDPASGEVMFLRIFLSNSSAL